MSEQKWPLELGKRWGPFEFGATFNQICERLRADNVDFVAEDEDSTWLELEDPEAELIFDDHAPHRLRYIGTDDLEFTLFGKTIIGEGLPRALNLLEVVRYHETLWQLDQHPSSCLSATEAEQQDMLDEPPAVAPEALLTNGTLWIRPLGAALVMKQGVVHEFVMVAPHDVPRHGHGPVTPLQLEVARSDDLADRLQAHERGQRKPNWLTLFATLALLVSLGVIAWRVFDDEQRWHTVPVVEGRVIAIEDQNDPHQRATYVVEYKDGQGKAYRARWTLADVYVEPKVGDTIEVRYLPEEPDRPMGPFALRNVGIMNYIPYVLGAMFLYAGILMFAQRRG